MDIDGVDDAVQLAGYQRIFPLLWEHPAVHGVTLWGFRPGLWRDKEGAALIRQEGSARPALVWLRQYVHDDSVSRGLKPAQQSESPALESTTDKPPSGMDSMNLRLSRVRTFAWRASILLLLPVATSTHAVSRHEDGHCQSPAAVCPTSARGAVALIEAGKPANILADATDFPGVLRAARDLRGDLSAVAGTEATFSIDGTVPAGPAIIIGTLGHSPRIDRIVAARRLDARDVAGRWEAYLINVVDNPEPGIARAVVIAGADKRGTIFGIYELSRRLGVSPWTWWADVPIAKRSAAYLMPGRFVDAPGVRYRGLFLNDEDPALGGWIKATYGAPNHAFYARVFELILRLKGNYLWPAMWGRAFADDDAESPRLADEFGVVIGTTHHEPMMRAHVEWKRYGKGPWDYTKNAEALRAFWRTGIERMNGYESVVTLGMRGDGDEPMTQDTAIPLLERIVDDQRRIIAEVTGKPAAQTPQVWALYKEVQDYYDAGMKVPDDVTLLFSDDNWGNLRRLPELGAKRGGGYGIYYHFDYVGGPRNYKWINTVQIERVWEQMQRAHAFGADRLWIVNVGDLKPMEFPISFFLDQAWNPDAMTLERLRRLPERVGGRAIWPGPCDGDRRATDALHAVQRATQTRVALARHLQPRQLRRSRPRQRRMGGTRRQHTATSANDLPAAEHDAWYELVEYPVAGQREPQPALHRHGAQPAVRAPGSRVGQRLGRGSTAPVRTRCRARPRLRAGHRRRQMAAHDGADRSIGYTRWQQPERNILPALMTIDVPAQASMGVTIEGDDRAHGPAPIRPRRCQCSIRWAHPHARCVVFNRGGTAFRYTYGGFATLAARNAGIGRGARTADAECYGRLGCRCRRRARCHC